MFARILCLRLVAAGFALIAASLSLSLSPLSAEGMIRRVPSEYATIQSAIDDAQNGDVVLIAPGIYSGPGNRDIEILGKAITVRSEQGAEATILEVEGLPEIGHRGFYIHEWETHATAIEGLTIRGGYQDWIGGAGLLIENASPTLRDCIIADNTVSGFGEDGGGLLLHASDALLEGCTIRGNSADYGGGIACRAESSPTIRNCKVLENISGYGGGIDTGGTGAPVIEDCEIRGNNARNGLDDAGWGGGLLLGGAAEVRRCIITGNVSGNGAGIACYGGAPRIEETTVAGNDASIWQGGGIVSINSSTTISRSVIAGNCAALGPALLASYGTIHLFCSVSDSAAVTISGGVILDDGENKIADPLFCAPAPCTTAPTIEGDYTISRVSICFVENSACGEWIGALGVGCPVADAPETGVAEAERRLLLAPPSPNPTPGEVQLTFDLPSAARARLRIVTAEGRVAAVLVDAELEAGPHTYRWSPRGEAGERSLASGVYFAQLSLPGSGIAESRPIVLLGR